MKFMAISKDVEKQWTHCRFPRGRDEELIKVTALQRKFPHQNCEKKIPEGLHQTSPPPYPYPHCLYARVLNTCLCWLNNARADKVLHEIFHWYYPTLPSCYLSWYFVGYGLSFNFMLWIHVISNPSPRGYQQLVSETLGLQFFIWN